ncbi:hypothetical protein ACH5RR_018503 [Cinchona calisaya]|uniref:Uncharacterized protein n=1 Tax=Cinchona calisaya TaxID=153742 RepID=A0ABD2ZMI8_9GENT
MASQGQSDNIFGTSSNFGRSNQLADEDVGVQKKLEKLTIHEELQETKASNEDDAHHLGEEGEKNEDSPKDLPKSWRFVSSRPQELIIGDLSDGVKTRSHKPLNNNCALLSHIEPKRVDDVLNDDS